MIITLSFRADKIGEESHYIQLICYVIPRFTRNDKGEVLLAFRVCLANKKGKSCAGCGTVQRKVKETYEKESIFFSIGNMLSGGVFDQQYSGIFHQRRYSNQCYHNGQN